MDIQFTNTKLQKACSTERETVKAWGRDNSKKVRERLTQLEAALNLSQISHLPPARLHQLEQNRAGQFSVDLKQPYRLIFKPNHDPVPRTADGGIDKTQVTAILILEVEDYHG